MVVILFGLDCFYQFCFSLFHIPHIHCLIISLNWYFVIWGSKRLRYFTHYLNIQLVLEQVHLLWFIYLSVIVDPVEMDWSQSLNAPPYFDDSNYAFWKLRMRAFFCSIYETVWDAVDVGWIKLEAAKSTWDKAALATANANRKALNAIFCGVSPDEFHRISHITIAKEAWQILETTYEGTKKVKETKL